MDLIKLANRLDEEFDVINNKEKLVEWAVTDDTAKYIHAEFLEEKTGLMTKFSIDIQKVYSVVFITDNIINEICKETNNLIFTHHQFNYFEDERGLQSIRPEIFDILKETANSIYVAHAPLDTHKIYGTSVCLAELCGVEIDKLFFDYFGAPTALMGHVNKTKFEDFCIKVKTKIKRPALTEIKNMDFVEKVAVVAGGGDMPEILQEIYDSGCDTLLTGTVEHRWAADFIQEGNMKFHELNKVLKRNLIGGTHYATERPAMIKVGELFQKIGIEWGFCEDEGLLNAV
ncbi:MAG: Nif3-like dinuclear metal center hexameric protein [Spirochaetales bacterium]|nr:Nif3-like dinuclear metal center hexameric protein [Spirochaetales bacterium]